MSGLKALNEQESLPATDVYDRLADEVEKNIDMQYLNTILEGVDINER